MQRLRRASRRSDVTFAPAASASPTAVGKLVTALERTRPHDSLLTVTPTPNRRRSRARRTNNKGSIRLCPIAFIRDVTCCIYHLLDEGVREPVE